MGNFSQKSIAMRAAIGAFVLYALLLQGFLATSAPASSLAFPDGFSGITCSLDSAGSGSSGGVPVRHHHHGLCCILACAATACAYVGTASVIAGFPERVAVLIRFVLAQGLPARPPLKHYFAARGPPDLI